MTQGRGAVSSRPNTCRPACRATSVRLISSSNSSTRRRSSAAGTRCSRPISSRFSRPVERASIATDCMAKPTRRRISAGCCTTSRPATEARPAVSGMRVARIRIVVVLPAPFGPRNPKNSPTATATSIPSSARVPPGYSLTRPATSMTAGELTVASVAATAGRRRLSTPVMAVLASKYGPPSLPGTHRTRQGRAVMGPVSRITREPDGTGDLPSPARNDSVRLQRASRHGDRGHRKLGAVGLRPRRLAPSHRIGPSRRVSDAENNCAHD